MNNDDFDELAGRIEGLANFVLHLAAELEVKNCINGPNLTDAVRGYAERRKFPDGTDRFADATRRMLQGLAQSLDTARMRRQ